MVSLFQVVFVSAHILALPWGLVGLSTYYPVKSLFHDAPVNSMPLGKAAETMVAYWSGPFAAPILVHDIYRRRRENRKAEQEKMRLVQERKEDIERKALDIIRSLSRFHTRLEGSVRQDYNEAVAALYKDIKCIAAFPERKFGSSAAAAIEQINRFTDGLSQKDKEEIKSALQTAGVIVNHT